ncbi:MAG: hypothetical protein ABIR16_07395 [Dokdonella sp.]
MSTRESTALVIDLTIPSRRLRVVFWFLSVLTPSLSMAQSYNKPESVEYHPRLNRHLVSSTVGSSIQSRAADGTITLFTAAPVAPYGIELLRGTLFVLDQGAVKGYDIDSAAPVMSLPLTGAAFLNGITSNGVDTLYVSDFTNRRIYTVNVANLAEPTQSAPLTITPQPNGLVFDPIDNRVLIGTWGASARILSMDPSGSLAPTDLIQTSLANIDGIALDCNGAIIVSAWSSCGATGGCLRRFDPPFALNSPAQFVANTLSSPADIDYSPYNATVGVPENSANRVTLVPTTCEASIFGSDFEQ